CLASPDSDYSSLPFFTSSSCGSKSGATKGGRLCQRNPHRHKSRDQPSVRLTAAQISFHLLMKGCAKHATWCVAPGLLQQIRTQVGELVEVVEQNLPCRGEG